MNEKEYKPYKDLKEQVEYEYDKFKQLTMAGSRESIFCKSKEIALKSQIADALLHYPFSFEEKNIIMSYESMIDAIYMQLVDFCGISGITAAIQAALQTQKKYAKA